jgi:hypothetical protein
MEPACRQARRISMKNLKPRRHQEGREKGMGSQNYLLEQNAVGSNVEDDKDEMGALSREMEDWYRGEEKRGMVGAA